MPVRVLIVDDSQQVAATLEIALSNGGWDTICADEVKAALEILNTSPQVDAIVTDLEMPKADGYSLITAVRAHTRCASAVIVVTSGSTAPNAEQRAITAGADAFFTKPYSPAAVRLELQRLMNGRGQVEQ
jgi:CheY-like chemotaxis protein